MLMMCVYVCVGGGVLHEITIGEKKNCSKINNKTYDNFSFYQKKKMSKNFN